MQVGTCSLLEAMEGARRLTIGIFSRRTLSLYSLLFVTTVSLLRFSNPDVFWAQAQLHRNARRNIARVSFCFCLYHVPQVRSNAVFHFFAAIQGVLLPLQNILAVLSWSKRCC